MPSDTEFTVMECYKDVMKPLVDVTEAIGGGKYVTVSVIRPLLHKLLNVHLKPATEDSRLVCMMKEVIRLDLQDRYVGSALDLVTKAAFLDPRFKSLPFLVSEERERIVSLIEHSLEELINSRSSEAGITSTQEAEPATIRPRGEYVLLDFLKDVVHPTSDSHHDISVKEKAHIEVSKYIGEDVTLANPLTWWSQNSTRYPGLSCLAKKYLCISATSVPAERAFSRAGHIVSMKRACLLLENVSLLVFLSANLQ